MQTYRTLLVVEDPSRIILSNLPFRRGQLVEVIVLGEEKDSQTQARQLASLFKETQTLPQVQQLTEEDIEAEIAAYRSTL